MAKFINISLTFVLLLITLITPIISRPLARSDLIDGQEFLSLFIGQGGNTQKEGAYDEFESTKSISRASDDKNQEVSSLDEEVPPDENFGLRTKQRSRDKGLPRKSEVATVQEITTPTAGIQRSSEENVNLESKRKQVIKMVTSGSKIVFLEEVTPSKPDVSTNTNSPLPNYSVTTEKDSKPNESRTTDSSHMSSSSSTSSLSPSDQVQVISVRVSSSVGQSRSPSSTTRNNIVAFTSTASSLENDSLVYHETIDRNDFISRSHKSEFSIDESDPVTQEALLDSVNGESTNIHSIVAAPSTLNHQQQQQQQQQQSQQHDNQHQQQQQQQQHHHHHHQHHHTHHQHHHSQHTAGSGSARMQRKQDKLVPFQTVIYHDSDYHKDGSNQPRSVSYSSIAQSIDDLKSWKDIDGLLEAKENVSQAFRQQIFSSAPKVFSEPEKVFGEPAKVYSEPAKMYGQPSKFYSEPSKFYSEPAKVYGQPEKQYGEPSKVYSEPSKVYSEPSKVYSQPAKMYGEPSKVYWPRQPTPPTVPTTTTLPPTQIQQSTTTKNPNSRRVIFNLDKLPYDLLNAPQSDKHLLEPDSTGNRKGRPPHAKQPLTSTGQNPRLQGQMNMMSGTKTSTHQQSMMKTNDGRYTHNRDLVTEAPNYSQSAPVTEDIQHIYTPTPEQNYEVEESVSVMSNGRVHGVQPSASIVPTTANPIDDSKVGYVVEGRNYRKYRVEEKTPDGFIVGEYGVVSHNDGSLRGVRYTADSNINPSLIHEALMKFLSL